MCLSRQVDIGRRIERHGEGSIVAGAAEVSSVDQLRTGCIQFGEEPVEFAAAVEALERIGADRKIDRRGVAGDVRLAQRIDGDSGGVVIAIAAQERGVDQTVAARRSI